MYCSSTFPLKDIPDHKYACSGPEDAARLQSTLLVSSPIESLTPESSTMPNSPHASESPTVLADSSPITRSSPGWYISPLIFC